MNGNNFVKICTRLAEIDLFGTKPLGPNRTPKPDMSRIKEAIENGRRLVPMRYGEVYVDPVINNLARIANDAVMLEILPGAISQHGTNYLHADDLKSLRRFLAVISDLFRSYLDRRKRAAAHFPRQIRQTLPPLATFQSRGDKGPMAVTTDRLKQLIGEPVSISVISLPATFADDPILWACLAHETGGHSVVHAEESLLEELHAGVEQALKGMTVPRLSAAQLTMLWKYWMDEAVADVYGLLNVGPMFAFNFAAVFSAIRSKTEMGGHPLPKIAMKSVSTAGDLSLDPHPTDILRIHLMFGAVEKLYALREEKRKAYLSDIKQLAALCASGNKVEISGDAILNSLERMTFDTSVPLSRMQDAARRIGGYIATAKLETFNNHSIQDIETWDDGDEARADAIRAALEAGKPIGSQGDDAELLAGATKRLLEAPEEYESVTTALKAALDQSFATDPIWNPQALQPILRMQPATSLPLRVSRRGKRM
jgi:hypothetical protein